jgi:hypothetical protein
MAHSKKVVVATQVFNKNSSLTPLGMNARSRRQESSKSDAQKYDPGEKKEGADRPKTRLFWPPDTRDADDEEPQCSPDIGQQGALVCQLGTLSSELVSNERL